MVCRAAAGAIRGFVCRQAVAAGAGAIRGFVQAFRYLSIDAAAGGGDNTGRRFAAFLQSDIQKWNGNCEWNLPYVILWERSKNTV